MTPLPWRGRGRGFSVRPWQPYTQALVVIPVSRRVKLFARNHAGCTVHCRQSGIPHARHAGTIKHTRCSRLRLRSCTLVPLTGTRVWCGKDPAVVSRREAPALRGRWLIRHRPRRTDTPRHTARSGAVAIRETLRGGHARSRRFTHAGRFQRFCHPSYGSALAATLTDDTVRSRRDRRHYWDPTGPPPVLVL